ncbi:hypothetical protein [Lentzea sp. CA-135723]|uniref:hypothetical protein n=1 Tax=Lentzea sp. CA-135723 TaxID=3239950 RepID=UPI003D8D5D8F
MPTTSAGQYTTDELDAMRRWIDDALAEELLEYGARSGLSDDPDFTVKDLEDVDVLVVIGGHYEGGLAAFLGHFHND